MIVTTDLHFTDRRLDSYRFKVFDWLHKLLDEKEEPISILGDITDAKDNHSNKLINKIVDGFVSLSERVPVYIIKGNHDFKDPKIPLFKFFNYIPNIKFFVEPSVVGTHLGNTCYLPYEKSPEKKWRQYKSFIKKADIVFTHITFDKAVPSNGPPLDGVPIDVLSKYGYNGYIFSGDIHIPQQLGKVIYVGSPYHIHFGDDNRHDPRIIRINKDQSFTEYKFETINKLTIRVESINDLDNYKIKNGDQVRLIVRYNKVSVNDPKKEANSIINDIKKKGAIIHTTKFEPYMEFNKTKIEVKHKTDLEIVQELVKAHKLNDKFFKIAKAIIEAGND